MSLTLEKSDKKGKKWKITADNGFSVHFGDPKYEDYTQHKDKNRRAKYIQRHAKISDFSDPETAGFWARWILWGPYSDIEENIKFLEEILNINIIF